MGFSYGVDDTGHVDRIASMPIAELQIIMRRIILAVQQERDSQPPTPQPPVMNQNVSAIPSGTNEAFQRRHIVSQDNVVTPSRAAASSPNDDEDKLNSLLARFTEDVRQRPENAPSISEKDIQLLIRKLLITAIRNLGIQKQTNAQGVLMAIATMPINEFKETVRSIITTEQDKRNIARATADTAITNSAGSPEQDQATHLQAEHLQQKTTATALTNSRKTMRLRQAIQQHKTADEETDAPTSGPAKK